MEIYALIKVSLIKKINVEHFLGEKRDLNTEELIILRHL